MRSAELPGLRQADLRVHVGAVHVDLAAVRVDHLADLADLLLEHAVGGQIGDHQRGEVGRVLLGLGLEVGQVHVAFGVAFDHHHVHADHLRRGRVGAVRRTMLRDGLAPRRRLTPWARTNDVSVISALPFTL
jgi:hypothetical protein